MVEIYWDDLTEEKQREILEMFGDNQNFDQFPITVLVECVVLMSKVKE